MSVNPNGIPVNSVLASQPTADDPAFTVVVPSAYSDFSDYPANTSNPRWHAVKVGNLTALEKGGSFSIQAQFQIENLDRPAWHYIFAHNKQEDGKEIFLRFREQDGDWYYQFGTWQNGKNYMVSVRIPDEDRPSGIRADGPEVDLLGRYDVLDNRILLYRNGQLLFEEEGAPDIGTFSGEKVIGAHDTLSINTGLYRVMLGKITILKVEELSPLVMYSDNDNNGYIHSDEKNGERAKIERMTVPCERRLTYFDQNKYTINGVAVTIPPDYRRAYLRVQKKDTTADLAGLEYRFVVEGGDGILVVKRNKSKTATPTWVDMPADWTAVGTGAADSDDLLLSTLKADNTYTDYYIAETVATGNKQPQWVTVFLKVRKTPTKADSNPAELTGGMVIFQIQEAPVIEATKPNAGKYEWIVPSGWTVTGTTAANAVYTTPMPDEPVTIGPQTEGSGWSGSDYSKFPNGDAISTELFNKPHPNKFKVTLKISFERNTSAQPAGSNFPYPNGYIQRDENKSETDQQTVHQLDMFGNSGLKFGNVTGGAEIQIYDTATLVNNMGVQKENVDHANGIAGDAGWIFKPPQPNDPNAQTPHNFFFYFNGRSYNTTKADNVISGNWYSRPGNRDNPNAPPPIKRWQDVQDAVTSQAKANPMVLEVTVERVNAATDNYNISTTVNGDPVFTGVKNLAGWDGRLYLQSHWGSGVKFQEVGITKLTAPVEVSEDVVIVETEQVAQTSKKTSVAFTSLLLWFMGMLIWTGINIADSLHYYNRPIASFDQNKRTDNKEIKPTDFIDERYMSYRSEDGSMYQGRDREQQRQILAQPKDYPEMSRYIYEPPGIAGFFAYRRVKDGGTYKTVAPSMPDEDGFMNVKVRVHNRFEYVMYPADGKYRPSRIQTYEFDPPWVGQLGTDPRGGNFSFYNIGGYGDTIDAPNVTISGLDFSHTDLTGTKVGSVDMHKCSFVNARLIGMSFASDHDTVFSECDFRNADFTDVIFGENCKFDFSTSKNLTLEQIKQTKNYKTGKMKGIKLPPEIQKALDEEKAKK